MKVTKEINKKMFREYDIRGIYEEDINEDVSYTIGKSFGSYVLKKFESDNVLVGHDNRISSPTISKALIQGVLDSGVNVVDLGLVTTPMYYFARKKLNINTGIMITASHNPKEYNGFKIAFFDYGNAFGKYIQDFMEFTLENNFEDGKGLLKKYDIKREYIELLKKSIDLGNRNVKVVVDAGNGTGSIIVKEVLDAMNIEYYPLYCESDGNFPNHQPDPAVKENMIDLSNKVKELHYDFGFAIDGDADRVGIVDEQGNIIQSDLYMLIVYRNIVNNLKNKKALFDVKCSKTLIDELEKLGIEPVMYRTGNSYTNLMMQEGNFDFGGEYSGHVFFRDKFLGFDDGIYGGLRILEIISKKNTPLSYELKGINKYFSTEELKTKTTDDKKFEVVEKVKDYVLGKKYDFIDIDGIRVNFKDGWALVRASNTGPNIITRYEANSEDRLREIKVEFESVIEQCLK